VIKSVGGKATILLALGDEDRHEPHAIGFTRPSPIVVARFAPLTACSQHAAPRALPFRYRDRVSGKWLKARYVAERHEIDARYAEWEIIGPPEIRDVDPDARYFTPWKVVPHAELVRLQELPPGMQPYLATPPLGAPLGSCRDRCMRMEWNVPNGTFNVPSGQA